MGLGNQPIFVKILFLLTVYLGHGRPFEGIADYAYAFLAVFLVLFGIVRDRVKPILVIAGLGLLIGGQFVPQLAIPEQERLLMDENRSFIPPDQFLKNTSKYPYFLTADGYLQGYKDKRMVRTIDIEQGLYSLRSGWMNRPEYNFYPPISPHIRANLPYVVCYEIVPSMIGMTLNLEGLIVFEKEGHLKIHDPAIKVVQLQNSHVGSILCGFGGQWDSTRLNNLTIKLEKTGLYKIYDASRFACFFLGLALLFFGLFSITITVDFGVQTLLFTLSTLLFWINFSHIFRWGIFAKGGKDGIIHDGFPYWMLEKWANGDWVAALMSPERVFYFMPGMRYVRFCEMLLFGDAYILQVCLLIFVPLIFYRFFSLFLNRVVTVVLILMAFTMLWDGVGLGFKMYTKTLVNLYGEGLAYALLFIAITLLAKSIQKVGWGILAFFLLAISITIRPNLGIFVGIIGGIHLFTTTFSKMPWRVRFIMLLGLAPGLLVPLHNILGGELVLVSKASQIPENLPLSLGMYCHAFSHILGLSEACEYANRFTTHFKVMYPQYVVAWIVCLWVSFKGQTPVLRTLGLATFAGLSVHFFYLPDLRYLHPYLTIAIVLGLSQFPRFRGTDSLKEEL